MTAAGILKVDDIKKFLYMFGFIFVLNLGIAAGETLLYSMMLIEYGAQTMPVLLLFKGIVQLAAILLSTYYTQAEESKPILRRFIVIMVLLLVGLYGALFMGLSFMIVLAYTGIGGMWLVAVIQCDIFIAKLFAGEHFREVYPKVNMAFALSSVFAGIIIGISSGLVGNQQSVIVVILCFIVSILWLNQIYRTYNSALRQKSGMIADELKKVYYDHEYNLSAFLASSNKSFWAELEKLKEGIKSIRHNPVLRYLPLLCILGATAFAFISFDFNTTISRELSESQVTQFIAIITVILNVVSSVFRFFMMSATIKRMSFARGFLIHSSVMFAGVLAIFMLLRMHSMLYWTFIVATVMYVLHNILVHVYYTSMNVIYLLVPERDRDQARNLTDGLGEALSTIVSSSIVSIVVNVVSFQTAALIALVPIGIYFLVSIRFSGVCYTAVRKILHLDPRKNAPEIVDAITVISERRGHEVIPELLALYNRHIPPVKRAIIKSLREIRTPLAYTFLVKAFFIENEELQKELIPALGQYKKNHSELLLHLSRQKVGNDVMREAVFYLTRNKRKIKDIISKNFLASPDDELKIQGMIMVQRLRSREFLHFIKSLTSNKYAPAVVKNALVTLHMVDSRERSYVENRIEFMLESKDEQWITSALEMIGTLKIRRLYWYLLQYVDNHTSVSLRAAALISLSIMNPDLATSYFSYHLSNRGKDADFFALEFTELTAAVRQKVIAQITTMPIEALDITIKNLFSFRHKLKDDIKELYAAIPRRLKEV